MTHRGMRIPASRVVRSKGPTGFVTLEALADEVQDELFAHVDALQVFGPQMGRPRVDTLAGSRHANMKGLRFDPADGVWRFAFAFDPRRKAVILCGGDKSGGSQKRFYRQLIERADARFEAHLAALPAGAPRRRSTKRTRKS
jgi:hypothetical protein